MNRNTIYKILIIIIFLKFQFVSAQTEEQRSVISNSYDLNLLSQLYNQYNQNYLENFQLGLDYVATHKLPLQGIDVDSSFFSLKGFDKELNNIVYFKTTNNTATKSSIQTNRVQNLHNGTTIGSQVQGENLILGIWDGGQPLANHQNLGILRVINKDGQYTTGSNAGAIQNGINHATHVSGTMIGNGTKQYFAKGMAPLASLWANTWDNDHAEMVLEAAQGLLVSNHSYSIDNRSYINLPGYFGIYSPSSRIVDQITYNADMYLPVYAAGNDRGGIYIGGNLVFLNAAKNGYDLLTHEMIAKNPIVVAAVEGISSYVSQSNGTNNVIMSSFSQWGPTDDFRIKPDISAKGVSVYSSTGTGIANYSILNGTSMAAPSITGVFSLWQQIHNLYWPTVNNNSGFMRAASLKALMIHTANEAGDAAGPDPKFGWGIINAEEGAKILKKAKENKVIFKEFTLQNFEQYEYEVILNGTEPLIATLAWTDAPSEAVQISESDIPLLINDLDLRVQRVSTNEVFYPWKLNKSWSNIYAFRGDNDVDPIEKIEYFDPLTKLAPAGIYKITVNHKGSLVSLNQKFSLIISGGIVNFDLTLDNEVFVKKQIVLFPNPTRDFINITNLNFDKIELYDITGKKINISYTDEIDFIKFDVSKLATGSYFIKLVKNNSVEHKQFLKK